MNIIKLDKSPPYIPFTVQLVGGSGKTDPSAINLIIYEEGGGDASFDSTEIASSPFTPTKINGKTGYYGSMIDKSELTANKFYIALWEITIDGISIARQREYQVIDSDTSIISTINTNLVHLKQSVQGRWKIVNDQLILYDSDETTPLLTYDLKDAAGAATSINPVERAIV